jgi:hypothetical protein
MEASINMLPDHMALTELITQFNNYNLPIEFINGIGDWIMLYPITLSALYHNLGNWLDTINVAKLGMVNIDTLYIVYKMPISDIITIIDHNHFTITMLDISSMSMLNSYVQ